MDGNECKLNLRLRMWLKCSIIAKPGFFSKYVSTLVSKKAKLLRK